MLVALVICVLYAPLFHRTGFDSHEHAWTYLRVIEYEQEFAAGHLPANFTSAFGGATHAFPFFYPPVAYWLTTGIASIMGDVVLAVHASFLLSVLASALGMSLLARRLTGDWVLSAAAGLAYATLPYRFVVVLTRGALAESWSLVWFPFLLLALLGVAERKRRAWVSAAVLGAVIILTHSITALYFAIGATVLAVAFGVFDRREPFVEVVASAAASVALAAWFVVPQMVYMRELWVSDPGVMWTTPEYVSAQAVPATTFFLGSPPQVGMRLWVGLPGLMLFPLSVLSLRRVGQSHRAYRIGLLCLRTWLCFAVLQLGPALWVGWVPAPFRYVQFPWRLLGVSGLLSVLGCVLFLHSFTRGRSRVRWIVLAAVSGMALLPYPDMREAQVMSEWTDRFLREALGTRLAWPGMTAQGEYIPRAVPRGWMQSPPHLSPPVADSGARLLTWFGNRDVLHVRAEGPGRITFPLFAYPFYQAVVDGVENEFGVRANRGFLASTIPSGVHRLSIVRRVPPWQAVGWGISAAAVAILGVACMLRPCESARSADNRWP
ncbi:6-pyruvoyl-tetrahydropterin synthase-related protein [Roseisolibacter sp. H3M3-2]|uniref:6-pyruvoyl-tetrahydropterin synthase-related protein n=1 Tax=Roseisolibacter sp. H3M3-2 TaxID=3031323 RepID=UPI0023DA939E|nr:6-pyruvoyl-tetrahydropterin synthase-related protein [Roseisolibacter sp. H3M3-2]MDF1501884.1 6-pyruvoyl-tetrahydropterin synthase-related protein [Roseisolibacter sp. H3M3-2]